MFKKIKSVGKKIAVGVAASTASVSAFAVDHSAILGTSITEGQANYTTVIVGVIGLAAIGFGIGMIVRAMK